MVTTRLVSAEELLEMGSDASYELWEGVLKEESPSNPKSSEIGVLLAIRMSHFVFDHRLGHMTGSDGGYILEENPHTVVAPDFGFVRGERLPRIPRTGILSNAARFGSRSDLAHR